MRDHPISQRRACILIGVDPKTVRRERPPDNPEIREEMHKIAEKRRRFGYRRVGVMLERKGMIMNEKKLYRIYREEGLSVRRRRGRKRTRGSRTPMPVPLRPNQRYKPVADAVKRLQIDLFGRSNFHEAHGRPRHRFGNGRSIDGICFVGFDIRLHEACWDDPGVMAHRSQPARQPL
jgi:hypothetical protein